MTADVTGYPGAHARPLDDEPFVLVVEAHTPVDAAGWLTEHRARVHEDLLRHGAVLLRGFDVPDADGFSRAARSFSPDLLDYVERAAPRTEVADRVFTSTEASRDRWIELHHEMSYSHNWPSLLYFYCDVAPGARGATPLASERRVFPRIPAEVKERFTRHGVRYVRNYGPDVDLPWQEVFQTTDRQEVEAYCAASGTTVRWDGDNLRTTADRQAVATHPRTGETVWFNHAHLFHPSALPAEVVEVMIEEYGPDGLPRNVLFGDGEPIEDEVIALLRGIYDEARVSFPWQRGDVLIVDNFLATHGREPFDGDRRVLVAMSDLFVATG
ncbi:TauD/TfdA family dioxygenase [Lentzea sp. NPDC060358]|uniref:TauD/TfdA family dioxygenase n=1 Tax=Lentzea sp. NPDC060358 TaxID=3347103 RepID=UPI0036637223